MSFKIVTDNAADLPKEFLAENNIGCINLSYIIDEVVYGQGVELSNEDFYKAMRDGKMPTTSQINPEEARVKLLEYLEESNEILCLSLSSGLSGSYNSVRMAAEDLMEERKDCKIVVVDTLSGSLGEGLLVYKAVQMKNAGKSMEETAEWLNANCKNSIHLIAVDDLFHLQRGGRVSKSSAVIGSIVGIKPMIKIDDEGKLGVYDKIRGRKKSLLALADTMEKQMGSRRAENDIVAIAHGDVMEDVEYLKGIITERFGIDKFLVNHAGPIIGSHIGPGTMVLLFMGEER